MKKLILSILILCIGTSSLYSQVQKVSVLATQQIFLEIPPSCKSNFEASQKDAVANTFIKFSKKYNINVTFVVDKLDKVISCSIPAKSIDPKILENMLPRSNGCVGDCGGTWACFWACFWDAAG